MNHQKIKDWNFDIDFYDNFLLNSDEIFEYVENKIFDVKLNRRHKKIYGDKGLIYEVKFKTNLVKYEVIQWDPLLNILKEEVEKLTKETYNICVIQRYPSGKQGIPPHQDKEMKKGTKIVGLSLGQMRKLKVGKYELELPSGSLYVLNPPTNSYHSHSIPVDKSTKPRISLTFRNYC